MMAGYAGLFAALDFADMNPERVAGRFSPYFLTQAARCRRYLVDEQADGLLARLTGGPEMVFPLGPGGFLAGLWDVWERTGQGFIIHMERVPIRQETIEICEAAHMDPYAAPGKGSALLLSADPQEALEAAVQEDIPLALIGRLTQDKAKKLQTGGRIRYLDKPARNKADGIAYETGGEYGTK